MMPPRVNPNTREVAGKIGQKGFTLIELLAVMGIIITLAALSMLSVRSITSRSASAKCLNNQRQLTSAIMNFANENNGAIPAMGLGENVGDGKWWTNTLVDGGYVADCEWNNRSWGSAKSGLFQCPFIVSPTWYGGIGLSSGVANFNGQSIRLPQVSRPAKTALLADTPMNGTDALCMIYNSYGTIWQNNWRINRHMNGGYVTFFDGHSEHLLEKDLIENKDGILTNRL